MAVHDSGPFLLATSMIPMLVGDARCYARILRETGDQAYAYYPMG